MQEDYIVKIENVSVQYQLSEFKAHSLKEWVINRLRGKGATRAFNAVEEASFILKKGESLALVGHNGSGKSTLLRVIAGIIPPTPQSVVEVRGRIAPMIELGAGFDGELSGRENIFLSCLLMGLDRQEILGRIDQIIDFSELRQFIETPVKNYSSGMYARLGFACATAVAPDLLIVDEVLAVGDTNFSKKCLRHIEELKKRGSSVILVSHDEGSVRRFCDRAVVMNQGKIVYDGEIDEAYRIQKDIMLLREEAAMTPEERRRAHKIIELQAKARRDRSNESKAPSVFATCTLMNGPKIVDVLNLTQQGIIVVDITVEGAEFFDGNTYFGFELRNAAGVRITGFGSEPKVLITEETLHSLKKFRVSFVFPDGVPHLCGGRMKFFFAINDRDMERNIFHSELLEFEATNPILGDNEHSDIITLSTVNPSVQWAIL